MPGPNQIKAVATGDVHPDFHQPLARSFNFRVPLPMYQAISARALANGCDASRIIRDLIRAGAAHMDPPMDVINPM